MGADGVNRQLAVAVIVAAAGLLLLSKRSETANDDGILDTMEVQFDVAAGLIFGEGPIAGMSTSPAMLDMLKRRERLVNRPYNLGDGGWTIGYGHFSTSRASLPDYMTDAEALTQFADDVRERGEKWVKLYVQIDLTQYQFDALVSIAFNLSPKSFKKFAASVNEGQGIADIAQQSVSWVASKFTNGIENRRNSEVDVFYSGVYA